MRNAHIMSKFIFSTFSVRDEFVHAQPWQPTSQLPTSLRVLLRLDISQ